MNISNHFADAGMLIKKPVAEVFQAFINPEITSKFWFTKSTGILEEGKKVSWTWEMYNHSIELQVKKIIANECIQVEWGNETQRNEVKWEFKALDASRTYVSIMNTGFTGTADELISSIRDATGGFCWVLSGLKAYLEYGIELNLIADRFPKEIMEH